MVEDTPNTFFETNFFGRNALNTTYWVTHWEARNSRDSEVPDHVCSLVKLIVDPTLPIRHFRSALKQMIRQEKVQRTSLVDRQNKSLLMHVAMERNISAMEIIFWMGLWAFCIDHRIATESGDASEDVMELSKRLPRSIKVRNQLNIFTNQENSLTDLMKAARKGDCGEVERLLQRCGNQDVQMLVRARDSQGNSSLHHACASGDVSTVQLFIKHGCNLKAANHKENNLLHAAVMHDSSSILEELIRHKAINVEDKNRAGDTPAMMCAQVDSIRTLKILIKAGAVVSQDLVGIAVSRGCLSFVKHCVTKLGLSLSHVDSKKYTVLHHACSQGNLNIVEYVLEHTERVRELLLARDHVGRTALHHCCDNNTSSHEILDLLLKTAEDCDVLHKFVNTQDFFTGKETCVLVCGRDKGRAAYHYVLSNRHNLSLFEQRIGDGIIDVSKFGKVLKSGWGEYPSDEVVRAIDESLITKAYSNLKMDASPLHLSVFKEKTEHVKRLVESGADVNVKDCFGLTPLHLATMRGDISLVKILDTNGADFTIEDHKSQTPLDIARLNEHKSCVNYIRGKSDIDLAQELRGRLLRRLSELRNMERDFQVSDFQISSCISVLRKLKSDIDQMLIDMGSSPIMKETTSSE